MKEEKIDRFSNVELFGMMLFKAIEKKSEPFPENKPEYMEDIEYPEVRTINEISEIIKHNQQMNNEAYNIWLNLINEINTETNNDRLKDYGYWDREIKNIYIWNQLPQSYDLMTQLLRKSLYFKNNLNNLVSLKDIKEQEYKPMENIIYKSDYLNNVYMNDDNIILKLNHVKQTFHKMYDEIITIKNIEEVQKMHDKWNDYINKNIKDEYNIPFQSGASKYLAIIVKDWIDQRPQVSGEKPEKLLEQIIGKKRDHEESDEEDRKRPKS